MSAGSHDTLGTCWCGHASSRPFSPSYVECNACGTLRPAEPAQAPGPPGDVGIYDKSYWLAHQTRHGFPDIYTRCRTDFCDRMPFWLRAQLKYSLPPGRVLELGAAHGGYVALLGWAGFESRGLELSSWVADFARRTFGVPMMEGPVEMQHLEKGSLDALVLMDVLEHLADPLATMRHCASLLRSDGVVVVQTPRYREDKTFDEMVATGDPFPVLLKEAEHLFLLTERAARSLFDRAGLPWVVVEPAPFSYDMLLVAGRHPHEPNSQSSIEDALLGCHTGRLVLAVLDHSARLLACEADREARLRAIEYLQAKLVKE
jgi:2-polyprenyl-3-methyl-5-hydroxy-6-metoxy-1,4-benzoquinol methylase